jgi:hypothetical protein
MRPVLAHQQNLNHQQRAHQEEVDQEAMALLLASGGKPDRTSTKGGGRNGNAKQRQGLEASSKTRGAKAEPATPNADPE